MRLSEILSTRRLVALGVLTSAIWCGQVQAQVLEQVPADAVAVFKVKNLDQTNGKIVKLAKAWGLDELVPEMKDPLGTALDKAQMTKGINKAGDAALIVFAPGADGSEPEPVALIPVSDYAAFAANFKKADDAKGEDGIDAVKDPDGDKTLYLAHRGNYAMLSDKKDHFKAKGGLKLSNLALRECDTKDFSFVLNMPVVREKALPAIKDHRKEMLEEMDKGLASQEQFKPFVPVFDTLFNRVMDTADEFLNDADSIVFSMNLGDAGISGAAMVDFKPDSKYGKMTAEVKSGNEPLLAGLPAGKYFFFAGAKMDHKAMESINSEWLDPITKSLKETNTDSGKKIANVIEEAKTVMGAAERGSAGMLVPTKPMGQESLVQEVSITFGDAKAIAAGEKKMLADTSELMDLVQQKGIKTKFVIGDVKTVDGVDMQSYSSKLEFDKNDPQGMQAEQVLAMIYGPNGQSGSFGAVNDKTFIMTAGVSDEVLKELIASAKEGKDVLSDNAAVKAVSAQLPANRSAVYFIALDNIVTSALRYAQGFGLQVPLKLPDNLAPIGVAMGTEGSSIRIDGVIPTDTIQAMIAAGLQAYMNEKKGGGL